MPPVHADKGNGTIAHMPGHVAQRVSEEGGELDAAHLAAGKGELAVFEEVLQSTLQRLIPTEDETLRSLQRVEVQRQRLLLTIKAANRAFTGPLLADEQLTRDPDVPGTYLLTLPITLSRTGSRATIVTGAPNPWCAHPRPARSHPDLGPAPRPCDGAPRCPRPHPHHRARQPVCPPACRTRLARPPISSATSSPDANPRHSPSPC